MELCYSKYTRLLIGCALVLKMAFGFLIFIIYTQIVMIWPRNHPHYSPETVMDWYLPLETQFPLFWSQKARLTDEIRLVIQENSDPQLIKSRKEGLGMGSHRRLTLARSPGDDLSFRGLYSYNYQKSIIFSFFQ